MKKWIFIVLSIVIFIGSITTGLIITNNNNSSFVFNISAITVEVNSTKDVEYTFSKNCNISFEIENENIASISNQKIYGHIVGKTYLNAKIDYENEKYYKSVVVNVVEETPKFSFDYEDTKLLNLGDEMCFAPTVTKGNVNASYTTSEPSVATIDENGMINTLKCGETDICVLVDNEIVKTCHVSVSLKFKIEGSQNCKVEKNTVTVPKGEMSLISVRFLNNKDEEIISNFNCSISVTEGITYENKFGSIQFSANTSGTITVSYDDLDVQLTIYVCLQ